MAFAPTTFTYRKRSDAARWRVGLCNRRLNRPRSQQYKTPKYIIINLHHLNAKLTFLLAAEQTTDCCCCQQNDRQHSLLEAMKFNIGHQPSTIRQQLQQPRLHANSVTCYWLKQPQNSVSFHILVDSVRNAFSNKNYA